MSDNNKEFKRGKNIIQKPLTLTHIYEYYIKDIDKDSPRYIDYRTFRDICNNANKMISTVIIDEGRFFKIPYRLGTIRIKKRKINFDNLKHDFGLYNKTGGEFKNSFLNEHSGNYYVRFFWTKNRDTIVKNKTPYSFIPTRHNKRYMASLIKDKGIIQVNKYFD